MVDGGLPLRVDEREGQHLYNFPRTNRYLFPLSISDLFLCLRRLATMPSVSFVTVLVYNISIFFGGHFLVQLSSNGLAKAVTFAPTDASYPGFTCSYQSLTGWEACNGPNSRDCWLRRRHNGSEHQGQSVLDIHTDYEGIMPPGVTREVRTNCKSIVLY